MSIKSFLFRLSLGLMLLLPVGCEQSYEASKKQRMQIAAKNQDKKKPIVIGVPWTNTDDGSFIKGVNLAVKEVNQKGGVLDHIPLQVIIDDSESGYYKNGASQGARRAAILSIAKSYADNPDLIAVIGHVSSETALIASVVYQNRGILFLAPNARFGKLTGHNFSYVFRTSLNNSYMGEQLSDYAAQKGYKRIAVLAVRAESTDEFVNEFVTHAIEKYHIEIVYRRSFFENNVDVVSLIADLKSIQNMDAIFIATGGKKAAEIYQRIREVGIGLPIIGNATLDTDDFIKRVKQWEYSKKVQKSNIPTLYNTDTRAGRIFERKFIKEYATEADYLSALGYDSVNVLAHAIQYAKSRTPIEIATTLRYMEPCSGVAGKYEFELNGDLKNKPVSFYHLDKNKFIFEKVNYGVAPNPAKMEVCNEVDRDGDGIPTNMDACPDSKPAEKAKGVNQDGAERGCPVDTDSDEIPDYKDLCSTNSAAEIALGVDARGCPVDLDQDKIADYQDQDIDGDNVANTLDYCPKNSAKERVYGVNPTGKYAGCPVDGDADGVPDYRDGCRKNTVLEISQGVDKTGCPLDKDFDDVLDYQDKCLNTPQNAVINAKGCEVLVSTHTLKLASQLFSGVQTVLTEEGTNNLAELLSGSNVSLLRKIQIIGYPKRQDSAQFQARLDSIAHYFSEQKIPLEKIATSIKGFTKKSSVVEFIFSEVKRKPAEMTVDSEPETAADAPLTKPESSADEPASKPKAGALQVQSKTGVRPNSEPSAPATRSSD
jgi:ABC-type branched-subunit amino acid transport system substrate-binding protein